MNSSKNDGIKQRIYECKGCGSVWMDESIHVTQRCGICGSARIVVTKELPPIIVHEMLRRNSSYNLVDITQIVSDSSVRLWMSKEESVAYLFQKQIELLTTQYTIMETLTKNV